MANDYLVKLVKQVGLAGEAAAAAGLLIALAVPRLTGSPSLSGLSARLGFNIGWAYLLVAALCLVAVAVYVRSSGRIAAAHGHAFNRTRLIRDCAIMFVVAGAAGLALVTALDAAMPSLIAQFQTRDAMGAGFTLAATLVPLVIVLVAFRVVLPRWARSVVAA